MDKEQLNRAFDSIQTSSQKKEQILGELKNMYSSDFLSEKKKRNRTKKAWMKKLSATAAIIVALVIPGAIFSKARFVWILVPLLVDLPIVCFKTEHKKYMQWM